MKSSQLFRKAGRGYNKEDVNNYILGLNSELTAAQERYDKLVSDSNSKAEKDYLVMKELGEKLGTLNALKEQLESLTAENEELKERIETLSKESEKAHEAEDVSEAYNNLCAKAGEVLVIASSTADDILKKANDEAQKIVSDANTKKDTMMKNISDTASSAADGLSDYIKKAVDDCINRINSSIKDVEALKDAPEDTIPVMKYTK